MRFDHVRLEYLHERLLRAGIAFRHARRIVLELRDHIEDAMHAEMQRCLTPEEAASAAWRRLGSDEDILAEAVASPALQSVFTRHQGLAFGLLPLAVWTLAVMSAAILFCVSYKTLLDTGWISSLAVAQRPADAVLWFFMYVFPPSLGLVFTGIAWRQRILSSWPLVCGGLLSIIGGFMNFAVVFSAVKGVPSSFNLNFAFADSALVRIIVNMAISLIPYLLWRHQYRQAEHGSLSPPP